MLLNVTDAARQAHEAENQFSLGAQMEAKAVQARDPKVSRQDYEAALAAYKQAHDLAPQNKSYKSAYERLLKTVKRK